MNVKINIHEANSNLVSRLEYIKNWNLNKSLYSDLVKFLSALGSGKVNKGKQISERTRVKYISLLKAPLMFWNKPLNKITLKDVEAFDKELTQDKLKSEKKKPYSYNMKVDIRIALKTLFKWKLGIEKGIALTDFLDTRDVRKTPDYLKESEVERLYKACKSAHERFLIAVLFDTGARAEEFLNIRYEDIQLPEGKENYVKITLKEEYSKTEGRTISLYWRQSLEAVRDYVNERLKEGMKAKDPVYNQTYDSARFFIRRLALKVLNRSIHFHLFRHSSATYYAPKMNRQELCYRYGWKFSSDMPDVYISRAGVMNKELDEKFSATEINQLKDELEKQKQKAELDKQELKMDNKNLGLAVLQLKKRDELYIQHGLGLLSSEQLADKLKQLFEETKDIEKKVKNK